jgi:hypothetical protein
MDYPSKISDKEKGKKSVKKPLFWLGKMLFFAYL